MDKQILLKEQTTHGKKDFPICVYCNYADKGYILDQHWHEEAEFIYIAKGNMIFYIDNVPVELHGGEALFVEGGQIHGGKMVFPLQAVFYSIVFNINIYHNDLLGSSYDSYILPLIENIICFPRKITDDLYGGNIVGCLLRIIESFYGREPGYEIAIISTFYQILYKTVSSGKIEMKKRTISATEKLRAERFKKTIEYVHDHYAQRISISDMAKVVNMSPNYFCNYFKDFSQRTPIEYLNTYRINRAAYLLRQTDKKITAISMDTGFYNISYFNKLFKQAKGCTPAAFRQQNGSSIDSY